MKTLPPMDYEKHYGEAIVTGDTAFLKDLRHVCRIVMANRIVYEQVMKSSKVPWPLIAAIHFRESSQNFFRHLHNGDPLSARTVHVPAGRPVKGKPPFTWAESASDALDYVWRPKGWGIAACLEFLERFNGFGYRYRGIMSPYLWNYTNKYTKGLFVADGAFDPDKVERRPGCVAILKELETTHGVSLDFAKLQELDLGLH